jgi:putative ABC transport system permease protein
MSWSHPAWGRIRRVFRLPATTRRLGDELDAELRFHLQGRVEDLIEREHLTRDEAEREARRRFGDFSHYRRQVRDIDEAMLHRRQRMELTQMLLRETRHATRTLLRTPSFSLIAALTLALGLGAATTIFAVLDRVVIRPLPYPNADRLIHLGTLWPKIKAGEEYALSKGQYFYFKQNSRVLEDLAMWDADMSVIPGDGNHPAERVPTLLVSTNIFKLIGVRPERGRLIGPEDELDKVARHAMITHGYWQRRFGGDPNVIGKRIDLGGEGTVEIVGVLPPNAALPEVKVDLWIRNYLDPTAAPQNNHTHHAIGLLKPGVTIEAAAADIKRVQAAFQQAYPRVYPQSFIDRVGFAMNVTSLRDSVVGSTVVRALWLVFGAVALVLIIAAANVANLFLVRIDARRREVAVRTALGAGRAHLAVHYLTESMLLALVAALGALGIGYVLLHTVLAVAPQSLPRLDEVSFDWRSAAFCLAAAAALGVVFGVLPLGSSGVDVTMLREGGRGLTTSRSRDLARRGLVLSQVAIAVVLLSGAALMAKSFAKLRAVQPGFDPTGVQSLTISVPSARYETAQQVMQFWHELVTRIEAIPGVTRAGATDRLPLSGGGGCTSVITDAIGADGTKGNCMPFIDVTPGYFEAMGITLKGTPPTWSSVEARTAPVVVSDAFAKRFWGDVNPIGHMVKPFNDNAPNFPVVATTGDVRDSGLQNPPIEAAYFPLLPPPGIKYWQPARQMSVVVRAPKVPQSTLVASIRQVLSQIDPQVPIDNVQSMELVVAKSMAQTSFTMMLLLISATIALALSAVGIYGVISYVVGQRRAEIGIRIALGAQVGDVSRLVVVQSLTLAAAGVAIGIVGAIAGTRLLGALLFDVSPTDPLTLAGTAAALLVVTLLASLGPTRRAARIDPVEAMRA